MQSGLGMQPLAGRPCQIQPRPMTGKALIVGGHLAVSATTIKRTFLKNWLLRPERRVDLLFELNANGTYDGKGKRGLPSPLASLSGKRTIRLSRVERTLVKGIKVLLGTVTESRWVESPSLDRSTPEITEDLWKSRQTRLHGEQQKYLKTEEG